MDHDSALYVYTRMCIVLRESWNNENKNLIHYIIIIIDLYIRLLYTRAHYSRIIICYTYIFFNLQDEARSLTHSVGIYIYIYVYIFLLLLYMFLYTLYVSRARVCLYIIYNGSLVAIPILVISSFQPRIRQETPSVAPSKLSVTAVAAAATSASWAIYNNIISTE